MNYEQIIETLKSNHFYPDSQTKNGKIIGLTVHCAPILAESKKARLEEILADHKVSITPFTNEGYILIKKIK